MKNTLSTSIELITPQKAKQYLGKNHPENRNISAQKVLQLAAELRDRNFQTTHQGILLGQDDVLLDGQHRLSAIAASGVSARVMVTRDPSLLSPLGVMVDTQLVRSAKFTYGEDVFAFSYINYLLTSLHLVSGAGQAGASKRKSSQEVKAAQQEIAAIGGGPALPIVGSRAAVSHCAYLCAVKATSKFAARVAYETLASNRRQDYTPAMSGFYDAYHRKGVGPTSSLKNAEMFTHAFTLLVGKRSNIFKPQKVAEPFRARFDIIREYFPNTAAEVREFHDQSVHVRKALRK